MQNKNIFWVLSLLLSGDPLQAEAETKTPLNREDKEEQKKPKNKRNKKRGRGRGPGKGPGRKNSNKKIDEKDLCDLIKDASIVDKAFKQNPSALKLDSEVLKTLLQEGISASQEAKNTAWKTLLTQNNLQPNEEQLASFLQNVDSEAQGLKNRTDDLEKQASFRFFVDQIASAPESDKKSARDAAYATIKMNMEKAGHKYNDSKFLKSLFHVLNHVAMKKPIINPQEFQKKGPLMQSLQDQQLGLEVQLKNLDQKISSIKTGTFSAAQVPLLEAKVVELESALQVAKTSLANISDLLGRSDAPLWKKNLEIWDSAFIPEFSQQKQESSKIRQEKNNSGQRRFNLNESRIKPPKKQKSKINSENFTDLLSMDEDI